MQLSADGSRPNAVPDFHANHRLAERIDLQALSLSDIWLDECSRQADLISSSIAQAITK